ncbi:hypothetical protein CKO42_08930 [Lamprobacter modestohalophilus]|uniref:Glycosyltransferase family 4 protein n=1 Tax=Lamprobacter modestohalophilus TaxID=1064514 RepID=A0A9X0W857_9GAMM|nr:glycosyltransferase [Lamprobacter modestohalophilus]MBK1618559.1 hypothetical protein [Lamprobacter modestohalophilus]
MRLFYVELCRRHRSRIPYIVHLEDNERLVTQNRLGLSQIDYQTIADGRHKLDNVGAAVMHPRKGTEFLRGAVGITALIDNLLETLPVSCPSQVFWPGYDPIFENPSPTAALRLRAQLGLTPQQRLTAYTGNVHTSNLNEVRHLYQAVARINQAGQPLLLLRTGQDIVPPVSRHETDLTRNVIHLGQLPRQDLPTLLRTSDILIQPGEVDEWNLYRVPSKLPEYLASSRPVLLPRANLGTVLTHGSNALIVDVGDAQTIAETVLDWLPRTNQLLKIGIRGGLFARRELSWEQAAQKVAKLYERAAT